MRPWVCVLSKTDLDGDVLHHVYVGDIWITQCQLGRRAHEVAELIANVNSLRLIKGRFK